MGSQSLIPEVPTRDECTMALLAHLLQIFTGFIGPLIIFCVKPESRFVKFHSLQSLVWQLCYMLAIFGGMIIFFFAVFASIFRNGPPANNQPPPGIFLYFPLIWLAFVLGWVANIVLGIVYGVKASRGEWAAYPLFGRWLRERYQASPAAPTITA